MKLASAQKRWLIADIGGTNSRLALWQADVAGRGSISEVQKLRNDAHPRIEDMLGTYLREIGDAQPSGAVLAIAGPVTGDEVRLLNINWSFSVSGLRDQLKLSELVVINDFEALAHVVPVLQPEEYVQIGNGGSDADAPAVIIGPGTGLGVASLVPANGRFVAVPGEGGHSSLPAASLEEARLIEAVRKQFGHCSAERILSGSGLATLHRLLHDATLTPAEISSRANDGDDAALATFEQFFLFLGTVASNVALTLGAHGGVYIGGGIVPSNLGLFERSGFRQRFTDKGRYREYLDAIPTRVITIDTPALVGLSGLLTGMQS